MRTPTEKYAPLKTMKSNNSLATYLFRNRYLLVLSIFVILVAGLSALSNLPRLEDPRITQRNPTIITLFPGASAERVEALISKPIEDELRELHEIKIIESTSRDGVSVVALELQDWVDSSTNEAIFSKIRDRLGQVSLTFPPGAFAPDFDEQRGATAFTILAAVSIPENAVGERGIQNRLAEELGDRLRNVGGTEIVRLFGDTQEEITVIVEEDELAALGMSASELSQVIAGADSKSSAGSLRSRERNVLIEVAGELKTLDRIASIPVADTGSGSVLYLGDIAEISKELQDPTGEIAFTESGNRSILVAARMTKSMRVEQWTAAATKVVEDFRKEFGDTLSVEIIFDQSIYTDERLGELTTNLILGVAVVMLVVLLSMGWKSSLIVGLALPLSMAGAVFSLTFFGEQIHQMTIFGMIIAIGLLIDNAIVITDEIRKNIRERGLGRIVALQRSVNHLKVPLLASTLTTILGFMPIFLLPGNIGDFISPIAISVVMALTFSFALSLTIIATLAALFTKAEASSTPKWWRSGLQSSKTSEFYRGFLKRCLNMPKRIAGVALVISVLGFILSGTLPNVFFPSADRDHFEVDIWLSDDASIYRTESLAREADALILGHETVERTHWMVGGSTPSIYYNQVMDQDNARNYAHAVVFSKNAKAASRLITQIQEQLDRQFPEARIIVRPFSQGPPVTSPVAFRVAGQNTQTLRVLGEQVRLAMEQHPNITHSFASIEGGTPKIWFEPDEEKVRLAGLTLNQVSEQFRAKLDGTLGGTVLEDLEELPVRVRVSEANRSELSRIASLQIHSPILDQWIPASALGEIQLRPELSGITRRSGERYNQIDAFLIPGGAPVTVADEVKLILEESEFVLPAGYRLELGGDADEQNEAIGLLMTYLPVLLVLMASTLILSFKSVTLAALLGFVAFLSAGLGFLALTISGYPLGFNPLVGSAGLMGVAINGSIVVLAAIRANPTAAAGDHASITEETIGCSRHIISTTFTTVAGFCPLLLSGGTFWPPLAVVIAGGVGFSVILSLCFTPAAYVALRRLRLV